jgi:hypothetical protein
MSRTLPLMALALFAACAHAPAAPSNPNEPRMHSSPEAAVQAYFQASDTGSSRMLRSAFHSAALMHWVDGATGTLRVLTQLEWWQRLDASASAPNPATERTLKALDREGPFALMEATSRWPTHAFHDLLLAVETPTGWRIVGKAFHRLTPGETLPDLPAAEQEIREVLDRKIQARARFSPTLLHESHTPDCLYYRVHVEGVPFGWGPLSEGAARYAENQDANLQDPDSRWRILRVDVRGTIAAAKLDVQVGPVRYIDHLLLVRTAGQWRISAASWGDPLAPR